MSGMRRLTWCVIAISSAGCAGSGEGLDENGRPIGEGGEQPLTPTLQSIQDRVFTPICSQCHTGAAAPVGLRLDEGSSFAMLVNQPSAEVPSLNRVTPGDPDASYLIQKLEGTAAVGAQMPLGQPPLPASTIAVIRQWIADGAQAASFAAPAIIPTQMRAIASGPAQVLVQAGGELNVATLTAQSVQLVRSGGDGSFIEGNEIRLTPRVDVRSFDPTVLAIRLESDAWTADTYRLTISGSGAAPVRDREGLPVSHFVMQFHVGDSL